MDISVKQLYMVAGILITYTQCNMIPSIPVHLQECYRSGYPNMTTPLRLDVFIDILRKVEQQADNLSLRIFTNSFLRSLRLDGIELAPDGIKRPEVIPYRATAFQFFKYKLLMDHFLPGQSLMVEHLQVLSVYEKCLLHTMLSSTVDRWERSDEQIFCPLGMSRRQRSVGEETSRIFITGRVVSRCPLEHGVIQTDWGTVAIGTVIAGIAASLEPQNVSVADIVYTPTFRNNLKKFSSNENAAYEIDEYIEQLVEEYITDSTDHQMISNVWVSTLAGLIIAAHIDDLSSSIRNLKLSDILLQYYTDNGRYYGQMKACERESNFRKMLTREKLLTETEHFSHILRLSRPGVIVTPAAFMGIINETVNTFMNYWPSLLEDIPVCIARPHEPLTQLPAEFIITSDGTWSGYQVEQLISTMSKTLNISFTGSTLGYIHGSNGRWVVPPSGSEVTIFNILQNYTDEWPNRLNLPNVLTTVIQHLNNKTFSNTTAVHLPTVLFIIAPTERITSNDLNRSRFLLTSLGNFVLYYDIKFVYVTTDPYVYYPLHTEWLENFHTYIQISGNSIEDVTNEIRLNLKTIQYNYRDTEVVNMKPCIFDTMNIQVASKSTMYHTVAKWNTNSQGGNLFVTMTSNSAGLLGCIDSTCYNLQKDEMTEFRIPIFPHSNILYDGITVSLTNNCEGWACEVAEVAVTAKYQCSSVDRMTAKIIILFPLIIFLRLF